MERRPWLARRRAATTDAGGRSRGQSLVEFALFLPLLLLILLIAVDFGRVFMGYVSVQNMVRIGANYAAVNPTAWQGPDTGDKVSYRNRYRTLMNADATRIDCTLPSPLPDPVFSGYTLGSNVRLDITCSFRLITPLLSSIVGDGVGNVPVSATTNFIIRTGSVGGRPVTVAPPSAGPTVSPPPAPTPTPTPVAEPTPTPTPTGSLDPSASPAPTASPVPATPTVPPVTVGFHGSSTSLDATGGGPAPSPGLENIVGIAPLAVTFTNTTVGEQWTCDWDFGDGTTSSSCGNSISKTYSTRGTYHVTLTVNGQYLTRPGYVLVACKVPSFSGVRRNAAMGPNGLWATEGFDPANIVSLGGGNYQVNYQSLAGGLVNPMGGCSGATIEIGP